MSIEQGRPGLIPLQSPQKKLGFAHFFAQKPGFKRGRGINRIGPRRELGHFRQACRRHFESLSIAHVDGAKIQVLRTEAGVIKIKRRAGQSSMHDEGNACTCAPRANGRSSDWFRCAGADELNVKGRPRNRPFLREELFKVRVWSGILW